MGLWCTMDASRRCARAPKLRGARIYIYIYVYIHTYVHTYTHTHTYTYIYKYRCLHKKTYIFCMYLHILPIYDYMQHMKRWAFFLQTPVVQHLQRNSVFFSGAAPWTQRRASPGQHPGTTPAPSSGEGNWPELFGPGITSENILPCV